MGPARVIVGGCVLLLAVTPLAHSSGQSNVGGYGISVSVPKGWHARVMRGALEVSTASLPPTNRPMGVALSTRLGRDDLGVLLFEDAPSWNVPFDTGVYRAGKPRSFSLSDFGPPPLGGSNPAKHSFARRNFAVSGRYFDLFVESGSARPGARPLAELNALVRSLSVRPGDFYPGAAPPARFPPARGWFTAQSKTVPVGPSTYSVSLASTVRYRDQLNHFPPHRTLVRLPADGIVIRLSLSADNRNPPIVPEGDPGRPLLRVRGSMCGSFEGAPPAALTCRIQAWRFREYYIFGWVIFGRSRPTPTQRARAQAELGGLELPSWPRWPASS